MQHFKSVFCLYFLTVQSVLLLIKYIWEMHWATLHHLKLSSFPHFSKMKYVILYLLSLVHMVLLLPSYPKCPFEDQFPFLKRLLDLTLNSLVSYNYIFFHINNIWRVPCDVKIFSEVSFCVFSPLNSIQNLYRFWMYVYFYII